MCKFLLNDQIIFICLNADDKGTFHWILSLVFWTRGCVIINQPCADNSRLSSTANYTAAPLRF